MSEKLVGINQDGDPLNVEVIYNRTERGFTLYEFKDHYQSTCSLQDSSLAQIEFEDGRVSDACIWLGMDEDDEGNKAHTKVDKVSGLKVGSRMHLSQSGVRALLPLLEYFVEHGELPHPTEIGDAG